MSSKIIKVSEKIMSFRCKKFAVCMSKAYQANNVPLSHFISGMDYGDVKSLSASLVLLDVRHLSVLIARRCRGK